jgi:hypothetical protein
VLARRGQNAHSSLRSGRASASNPSPSPSIRLEQLGSLGVELRDNP